MIAEDVRGDDNRKKIIAAAKEFEKLADELDGLLRREQRSLDTLAATPPSFVHGLQCGCHPVKVFSDREQRFQVFQGTLIRRYHANEFGVVSIAQSRLKFLAHPCAPCVSRTARRPALSISDAD